MFPFLGSDKDDTVGTTRTINSRSRSILQNINSFNIGRVDILNTAVLNNHAVNNIQRPLFGIDRALPANIDISYFTGSLAGGDVHTCCFSLHSFQGILNRHCFQFFFSNPRHSTGYVAFFLNAISHNYYFIQRFRIFLKCNLEISISCDRNFLFLISYISNCYRTFSRYIREGKFTIQICYSTIGSAID